MTAPQPPYGQQLPPPYGQYPSGSRPAPAPGGHSGSYPPYPPQQYPGQQYPGQQYPGQQYPGQQYSGQQYPGQPYPPQPAYGQRPGGRPPSGPPTWLWFVIGGGLAAAAVVVIVLVVADSGGGAGSVSGPAATAPSAAAAPAAGGAPAQDVGTGIATWGQRYTRDDGLAIEVSVPEPFEPSDYSAGHTRDRAVVVTATIVNGSDEPYEVNTFALGPIGTHAGRATEEIFDLDADLGTAPLTTVLPGESFSFRTGLSIGAEQAELHLEYSLEFLEDPAIFVGPA